MRPDNDQGRRWRPLRWLLTRWAGDRRLGELLGLARLLAHKRVARITGGPVLGELPARYVDSVLATAGSRPTVLAHVVEARMTDEPCIVRYEFPDDYPPMFHRSKAFDARWTYRVRDVSVSPMSGLAWLPDGSVLGESLGSLFRVLGWGNVVHQVLGPVEDLGESRPVVTTLSRNYGHWLFESLPNLLDVLEQVPDACVLLPEKERHRPSFVLESLELALGRVEVEARVRFVPGPVRVDDLVVRQMPVDPFFIHPSTIARLRTTFLNGPSPLGASAGRRLYVSRSRSYKRPMANELEVHEVVTAHGFEVVHSEDLSFGERVETFRTASIVVGPYGAGLANLAWAPLGCEVLELLPVETYNDYYARLSVGLGHHYDHLWCERHPQAGMTIDLAQLERRIVRLVDQVAA